MLILTRRIGESLLVNLSESVDPDMTVGELFARGPVAITLLGAKGNQIRIGIGAPLEFNVVREELLER